MPGHKVVIPFPSDTIRLNGILRDTLTTIRCATSNLTYKEYLRTSSTFLLVSSEVIAGALKSISTDQAIYFETPMASLYAEKHIDEVSPEMVLTSLLIASMEKTMAIYAEFSFSDELEMSAEKAFEALKSEIELEGMAAASADKSVLFGSAIGLDGVLIAASAEKHLDSSSSLMAIEHALDLSAEKHCGEVLSQAAFTSIARFSLSRYRLLVELDEYLLTDIDTWDMDTLDMITV